MDLESKSMKGNSVARHCAYCLQLCGSPIKICGGCKRRAYCSQDCQLADWSSKGNGQRHVNWCRRHECGEEDVDWQVVPIPNKGLGIRAKNSIPAGFKIIVEPVFSSHNGHPGIKDLEPKGDTLENKMELNCFLGTNLNGKRAVALRIARVNHSCQPNAESIYDETACVAILFALKDIQPGEEISICYFPLFYEIPLEKRIGIPDWNPEKMFYVIKNEMLSSHGITCPKDCSCKDPVVRSLVHKGIKISNSMVEKFARPVTVEGTLTVGEKMLDIHRRLNISWAYRARVEYRLFKMAVQKSEFLPRAMEHIRSATELFRNVCPYSERHTKKYEKLLAHPETDSNYLLIDKGMESDLGERLRTGLNLS